MKSKSSPLWARSVVTLGLLALMALPARAQTVGPITRSGPNLVIQFTEQLESSPVLVEPYNVIGSGVLLEPGAGSLPPFPPTLLSATADCSINEVVVTFSAALDTTTASSVANYSCSGGVTITSALLAADNQTVTLSTTALGLGVTYTLTVNHVKDLDGTSIAANSRIAFMCSINACLTACPAGKTVECGSDWSFDPPINSCADVEIAELVTVTEGLSPMFVTRTWSITDPSGASETCSQTVTVNTTENPGNLYPIALNAATLAGLTPGSLLPDIFNGSQPGNFGWLTWAGSPNVPTLTASLTPPGNSSTYVNPANHADHIISVGDWVQGSPGVSNSSNVRNALDTLKTIDINVPIWDQASGNGNNTLYRVAGFARVRIISYQLPGQNRITARYLGSACP